MVGFLSVATISVSTNVVVVVSGEDGRSADIVMVPGLCLAVRLPLRGSVVCARVRS
jgi:hypothetical protein